jgi:hypothetical protein
MDKQEIMSDPRVAMIAEATGNAPLDAVADMVIDVIEETGVTPDVALDRGVRVARELAFTVAETAHKVIDAIGWPAGWPVEQKARVEAIWAMVDRWRAAGIRPSWEQSVTV